MTVAQRDLPQGKGARQAANATLLAERRAEAWRLRTEERLSYRQIGEALGCDQSAACRYVAWHLEQINPTPEDVENHRTELITRAATRCLLWLERADELHEQASILADTETEDMAKETVAAILRGTPALHAQAVAAERTAIAWAEKLAKWAGVESPTGEPLDPEREAHEMVQRVELFLAAVAEIEKRRPASE